VSATRRILLPAFIAIVAFAAVVWAAGGHPLQVILILLTGGGTWFGLWEAMAKAIPILLCALAVAVPGRLGLTNIGGEGQFLLGSIGASVVALSFPTMPIFFLQPAMIGAAMMAGGLWGAIPGALRSFARTDETVISLLLNYVAALLLLHLVNGALKDPAGMGWPQSAMFGANARIEGFLGTRVHVVVFLALGAAMALSWAWRHTVWGFSARTVGANPILARHMRVPVGVYYFVGFCLAGALAGAAGFGEVSAIHGRLREGISLGYGYAGFFVAWLSGHRFVWCVPASLVYALVITGADSLQIETKLPFATIYVFQGALFLAVLVIQKHAPANVSPLNR